MEKRFDVVGLGLIATDRIVALPRFPRPGDKLRYESERISCGGQVAGACVVARRYGLIASFCGAVGEFGVGLAALTLGPEGVLAASTPDRLPRGRLYVPGFVVTAVDTTGAGDILHGGFLVGLLRGWPLVECLEFGCALAALNCTAAGARGHIAPGEEVARLRREAPRRRRPGW